MKNMFNKLMRMMVLASALLITSKDATACGPNGWLANFLAAHQDDFNAVLLEGQEYAKNFVKSTIKSLVQLYQQNPVAFTTFIVSCVQGGGPAPEEILPYLIKFGLVNDDATVSSMVSGIVNMVVEQQNDGMFKIWSLQDLIAGGWVGILNSALS